ncbi:hypothetical protein SAMN05444695_1321 [Rhodococcus triatomae]|uniref:Uncharacterized protein n=1 Tax=Rhodococcus triatomae TaxID=300028 RepID=A0A1G8T0W6_9NOCA|nr:hypothetical protein SAMN05444695_1321 [Rhodococcus triatomae]
MWGRHTSVASTGDVDTLDPFAVAVILNVVRDVSLLVAADQEPIRWPTVIGEPPTPYLRVVQLLLQRNASEVTDAWDLARQDLRSRHHCCPNPAANLGTSANDRNNRSADKPGRGYELVDHRADPCGVHGHPCSHCGTASGCGAPGCDEGSGDSDRADDCRFPKKLVQQIENFLVRGGEMVSVLIACGRQTCTAVGNVEQLRPILLTCVGNDAYLWRLLRSNHVDRIMNGKSRCTQAGTRQAPSRCCRAKFGFIAVRPQVAHCSFHQAPAPGRVVVPTIRARRCPHCRPRYRRKIRSGRVVRGRGVGSGTRVVGVGVVESSRV